MEEEERDFYERRAPKNAINLLGTDSQNFFGSGSVFIAILPRKTVSLPDGRAVKHYYVSKSVGIATGMLITALHNADLRHHPHTKPDEFSQ